MTEEQYWAEKNATDAEIDRLREQLAECEEENKDIDADYEKVTKERDELLTIITQLRADIDAHDVLPEWLPIIDLALVKVGAGTVMQED